MKNKISTAALNLLLSPNFPNTLWEIDDFSVYDKDPAFAELFDAEFIDYEPDEDSPRVFWYLTSAGKALLADET